MRLFDALPDPRRRRIRAVIDLSHWTGGQPPRRRPGLRPARAPRARAAAAPPLASPLDERSGSRWSAPHRVRLQEEPSERFCVHCPSSGYGTQRR